MRISYKEPKETILGNRTRSDNSIKDLREDLKEWYLQYPISSDSNQFLGLSRIQTYFQGTKESLTDLRNNLLKLL